jgi:hypothetical protein
MQLDINSFEHRREVTRDFRVLKSNDTISFLLKPELALALVPSSVIIIVMSTVEFDNQVFSRTEEIHDIRTNRRLAPEVSAFDRKFFQRAPQDALVRRRVGTQSFSGCPSDRS